MSTYIHKLSSSSTESLTTSDVDSSKSEVNSSTSSSPTTLSPTHSTTSSSSSPTSDFLPPFVPAFPYTPSIRVPPPLLLSETPLRERRQFTSFITFTPRVVLAPGSAPMPAKGQLGPKAGALPRRRRASTLTKPGPGPVVIHESKRFEIELCASS